MVPGTLLNIGLRWVLWPVQVSLLLGGCGFHLRTWDLEGNVESARVIANARNPLAEPLARALRSAGVELVEGGEADVVIELLADRRGRRSVSVTDQARAAEYETSLQVQYAVRDGAGAMLMQPRWVAARRVYRVDRDNLVGSSQEQALLEREMVNDLVEQVLRGINTVVRSKSSVS
jgi:LPS-assembly lipoprotein